MDGLRGREVPIPPKRQENTMNVCASLRADEDIGPYQMPQAQQGDIIQA